MTLPSTREQEIERALRGSCGGKRRYASKRAAKKAMRRVQSLIAGSAANRTYRCPRCNKWHLSSQPRWPERDGERQGVAVGGVTISDNRKGEP